MENELLLVELPDWPEEAGLMPRNMRTPHTEAACTLAKLDEWAKKTWSFEDGEFIVRVFGSVWENNTDPDKEMNAFSELCDQVGILSLACARIAATLCAKAFREYPDGDLAIAWSYALDAESWYGTLLAGQTGIEARLDERAKMAKKGADATHSENRSMKAEVFAWLVDNREKFKSKEKAGKAITELQPIAQRTAVAWVTEWEKLQSAGTL